MNLYDDYKMTLEGELSCGAADTIWTKIVSFLWAFRRLIRIRRLTKKLKE